MTRRLTVEACIAIFEQDVRAGVLLDRARLEGAVNAPYASFAEVELFPLLAQKAARLAYGIAEAQAFSDGNKRLAWLSAIAFLAINHTRMVIDQDGAADLIWGIGQKRVTLEDLTTAFIDSCVSL